MNNYVIVQRNAEGELQAYTYNMTLAEATAMKEEIILSEPDKIVVIYEMVEVL